MLTKLGENLFTLAHSVADPPAIDDQTAEFCVIKPFPWTGTDINRFWLSEFANSSHVVGAWTSLTKKFCGVIALGGGENLRLIASRPRQPYVEIQRLDIAKWQEFGTVKAITWAVIVSSDIVSILLVFATGHVAHVVNMETGSICGRLSGHGGTINALEVHPTKPNILATASDDHSIYLHNLVEQICFRVEDIPAFPEINFQPDIHSRTWNWEGEGHGRCFAILCGGHSGGHQAAVTDVAFHPYLPVIVSCGADHAIKIWRLPVQERGIGLEDKPIFSSTTIHPARVTSIFCENILLSNCAPVYLPPHNFGPGTIVVWQWLGLRRFFPEGRETNRRDLRGCSSDFSESASYKIVSEYLTCPKVERHHSHQISVLRAPGFGHMIALPWGGALRLTGLDQLEPTLLPLLVHDPKSTSYKDHLQTLPGYLLTGSEIPAINACAFVGDGQMLVGAGSRNSICVWRNVTLDNEDVVD